MKTREDYIAEDFTATIPVAEYMANYRDAEKFIGFCRQCTAITLIGHVLHSHSM